MNQYEVLYIIVPEIDEEATRAAIEKFKGIAESNGAEIVAIDEWASASSRIPSTTRPKELTF